MYTINTKNIKYNFILILILILGACTLSPSLVKASYSVTPLVIDELLEARDIITKTITIENTGTQPYSVYPTVNNISLEEGGTIEEFLAPVESDRTASLASWLEISRQGIDLMPGMKKELTLTIRVNPNPAPGTYHAFVGFPHGGNRPEAEIKLGGGVPGTMITVTIEDQKSELLKLSKFIVSRFVTKNENQAAVFSFTNPGDEPVVPKGEIILYDSTGKEVRTLPINENNATIKPGEEFSFTGTVPTEGLFGKYKAYLSVEYGTQRASIQDTSFFYVFPMKTLLIVFCILSILVIIVAWYVHKKYLDEDEMIDDSERLTVRVREGTSEPKHHDIDLKNVE